MEKLDGVWVKDHVASGYGHSRIQVIKLIDPVNPTKVLQMKAVCIVCFRIAGSAEAFGSINMSDCQSANPDDPSNTSPARLAQRRAATISQFGELFDEPIKRAGWSACQNNASVSTAGSGESFRRPIDPTKDFQIQQAIRGRSRDVVRLSRKLSRETNPEKVLQIRAQIAHLQRLNLIGRGPCEPTRSKSHSRGKWTLAC